VVARLGLFQLPAAVGFRPVGPPCQRAQIVDPGLARGAVPPVRLGVIQIQTAGRAGTVGENIEPVTQQGGPADVGGNLVAVDRDGPARVEHRTHRHLGARQ